MYSRLAMALMCVGGSVSTGCARPAMPANELTESPVVAIKVLEKHAEKPDLPSILRAQPHGHEGPKAPEMVLWHKATLSELPAMAAEAAIEAVLISSAECARSI